MIVCLTFQRHADGGIAVVVPILDPNLRSAPAPAVYQHDGRDLALALFGKAEPRKNLRRFALVIRAGVENRLEVRCGIAPLDRKSTRLNSSHRT